MTGRHRVADEWQKQQEAHVTSVSRKRNHQSIWRASRIVVLNARLHGPGINDDSVGIGGDE